MVDMAFADGNFLLAIHLPDSVTEIESYAFYGCGSVTVNERLGHLYFPNLRKEIDLHNWGHSRAGAERGGRNVSSSFISSVG